MRQRLANCAWAGLARVAAWPSGWAATEHAALAAVDACAATRCGGGAVSAPPLLGAAARSQRFAAAAAGSSGAAAGSGSGASTGGSGSGEAAGFVRGGYSVSDFPPERIRNFSIVVGAKLAPPPAAAASPCTAAKRS